MSLVYDLQGTQSRDHGERGIARFIFELALALETFFRLILPRVISRRKFSRLLAEISGISIEPPKAGKTCCISSTRCFSIASSVSASAWVNVVSAISQSVPFIVHVANSPLSRFRSSVSLRVARVQERCG